MIKSVFIDGINRPFIEDSTASMFDEQIIKEYEKMQGEHPEWGPQQLYKAYLEKTSV